MINRTLGVLALVAVSLAGCGTSDVDVVAAMQAPPRSAAIEPAGPIMVASFDFTESRIVAEIYAQALEASGYPVERAAGAAAREVLEPALEQGLVDLIPEDMRLGDRLRGRGIHMAWLSSGGVQGRNPMVHAASMLEMIGIPYVGHDPLIAGILDNKHVFKREMRALDLPTPPDPQVWGVETSLSTGEAPLPTPVVRQPGAQPFGALQPSQRCAIVIQRRPPEGAVTGCDRPGARRRAV